MRHLALLLSFVLTAALTVTSTAASAASDAGPRVYIRSNGQFVAGGNEYPRSFWVPVIRGADEVFAVSPEAAEEYRLHVKDGEWFAVLNWGALGVFLTYVAVSGDDYDGGVGLALFAAPWIGGIIMATKSNQHLLKAINLVNGVPASEARWTPVEPVSRGTSAVPGAHALMVPLLAWQF
jgi:hypothetical protein